MPLAPAASPKLPEELWASIFEYCDSTPPSIVKARLEPSLDLTKSTNQTLKNISVVSKDWRRIVLPLLFTSACLQLDLRQWAEEIPRLAKRVDKRADVSTSRSADAQDGLVDYKPWIPSAIEDFCGFVLAAQLAPVVQSFVLVIDRAYRSNEKASPEQRRRHSKRPSPAVAAALWQYTLSIIDPGRVVIMAPPNELHSVVSPTEWRPHDGDWVWTMTNLQMLELRQEQHVTPKPGGAALRSPALTRSKHGPCLLVLREWQHLGLNEGSFLSAYGTYDYFERGAPLLVQSITRRFGWDYQSGSSSGCRWAELLSSVHSFTYTAIFPFATHTRPIRWLKTLEVLDVQLAPDPQSGMLDDKSQTGRADLQDCWRELLSVYRDAADMEFQMTKGGASGLRKIICRDARISALRADLSQAFHGLTSPRVARKGRVYRWSEDEPGVFIKHALERGSKGHSLT